MDLSSFEFWIFILKDKISGWPGSIQMAKANHFCSCRIRVNEFRVLICLRTTTSVRHKNNTDITMK
jgi:hypothetical protein